MANQRYISYATWGVFLCSIPAVLRWNTLPFAIPQIIWWILYFVTIFSLYKISKSSKVNPIVDKYWKYLLLFNAMYGALYYAELYWDYKLLISNLFVFVLTYEVIRALGAPVVASRILKFWFKYFWILIIILIPFSDNWSILRILAPFVIPLLFFPIISGKYRILTVVSILCLFPSFIESRADLLRYGFAVCICIGIMTYKWYGAKLMNLFRISLLLLPLGLAVLGLTGTFNIFEDITTKTEKKGFDEGISADTRTFIYVETITSAIQNDYLFLGHSMARGYETVFFENYTEQLADAGRGSERSNCEVCILNILTYFGLVGVVIFCLIFYIATNLAVNHSRNKYMPWVGLYLAFRFALCFIEEYPVFEMNWIVLWMFVAMCFSESFRNMSNIEFESWVKTIL